MSQTTEEIGDGARRNIKRSDQHNMPRSCVVSDKIKTVETMLAGRTGETTREDGAPKSRLRVSRATAHGFEALHWESFFLWR